MPFITKFLTSILIFSVTWSPPVSAALKCNLGGSISCVLKHDRGFGNFFHTFHRWKAGTHGVVLPDTTIFQEFTTFICTCPNQIVAVSVDYDLLFAASKNDTSILRCPGSVNPTFDI